MPYQTCPRCHRRVYSAARYSTTDRCIFCSAPLGSPRAAFAERVRLQQLAAPARKSKQA